MTELGLRCGQANSSSEGLKHGAALACVPVRSAASSFGGSTDEFRGGIVSVTAGFPV
jgi:hypothetical protein